MFKLEAMEQMLKTFKELPKEMQDDIMTYEMGSVLHPRKRPVDNTQESEE